MSTGLVQNIQFASYDSVICYICANHELKGNLISASNKDYAFISTGFCNWKKATMQFDSHMRSSCHKTALKFHVTVPACKDIEAILSSEVEKARKSERNYFRKVMETVQELARQEIPFQSSEDNNDNFCRMLLLRGKDDPEVAKRVLDSSKSKMNKYTHVETFVYLVLAGSTNTVSSRKLKKKTLLF